MILLAKCLPANLGAVCVALVVVMMVANTVLVPLHLCSLCLEHSLLGSVVL